MRQNMHLRGSRIDFLFKTINYSKKIKKRRDELLNGLVDDFKINIKFSFLIYKFLVLDL